MYYSVTPIGSEDSLEHYGVLGMKWGIHKGRNDEVYTRATKKLNKRVEKAKKHERKAQYQMDKANRAMFAFIPRERSAARHKRKARKQYAKMLKQYAKAQRWYNQMDRTLKRAKLSMHENEIETGKLIAERLMDDLRRSLY